MASVEDAIGEDVSQSPDSAGSHPMVALGRPDARSIELVERVRKRKILEGLELLPQKSPVRLPVGGKLNEPAMESAEEMLLEADDGSQEIARHSGKNLREMLEEGGSNAGESSPYIDGDLAFLDRYLVLEVLGQGGMGTVLKTYDEVLRRVVAVKLLHGVVAERHGERLVREAQALAQISHPNVVQVFDFGVSGRQAFVAMELVEGQTLREWQNSVPRPSWVDCVRIYIQVGRGLAAMHERGLTHRDFKPDNCVVDDDERQPRVIDFGLVGAAAVGDYGNEQDSRDVRLDWLATKQGVVMGTPAYMPPEQMQAKPTNAQSDQFSFCVALYEAVYGELPFDGETFEARAERMQRGKVRPAPRGSRVPHLLRQALLRGLAAEPANRWPTMNHLIDVLEISPFPALMPLRIPLIIIVMWAAFSGGFGVLLQWAR